MMRWMADRERGPPHYEDVLRCVLYHVPHGWPYVEGPDGNELLFGMEPQRSPREETAAMMVLHVFGHGDDPIEGRAWLHAPKVTKIIDLDYDGDRPDPDAVCAIGLGWQREHAPVEVARELWQRLELPTLDD